MVSFLCMSVLAMCSSASACVDPVASSGLWSMYVYMHMYWHDKMCSMIHVFSSKCTTSVIIGELSSGLLPIFEYHFQL